MSNEPTSAAALIGLWPSQAELAQDLGVKPYQVRDWKRRGWIPPEHDIALVRAARIRNLPVTLEVLALARSFRAAQAAEVA
jgi:hypothetical protein